MHGDNGQTVTINLTFIAGLICSYICALPVEKTREKKWHVHTKCNTRFVYDHKTCFYDTLLALSDVGLAIANKLDLDIFMSI